MNLEDLPEFREVKEQDSTSCESYLPFGAIEPISGLSLNNDRYVRLSMTGYRHKFQIYALGKITGAVVFDPTGEFQTSDYAQPKLLYRLALGTFIPGLNCAPTSLGPLCTLAQDQISNLEVLETPSFTLVSRDELRRNAEDQL